MTTTYRDFTYEQIAGEFVYDPEAGTLCRKLKSGALRELSLYVVKEGKLGVDRVRFRSSYQITVTHIMWMLMIRRWPTPGLVVDHRDRDVTNCRWANLREATPTESLRNRGERPRVWSDDDLVRGVEPVHNASTYRVRFRIDGGPKISFGTYRTKDEANEVARKVRAELHGEFFVDDTEPDEPDYIAQAAEAFAWTGQAIGP